MLPYLILTAYLLLVAALALSAFTGTYFPSEDRRLVRRAVLGVAAILAAVYIAAVGAILRWEEQCPSCGTGGDFTRRDTAVLWILAGGLPAAGIVLGAALGFVARRGRGSRSAVSRG